MHLKIGFLRPQNWSRLRPYYWSTFTTVKGVRHGVLQGAAQKGAQLDFIYAVLWALFFSSSKMSRFYLKTCTPMKGTPWSTAWVRIFSGGVGVVLLKGWGPKSSVCPSKPGKSDFFGLDIPGYCSDIPVAPAKFEKNKLCSVCGPWKGVSGKQKVQNFQHIDFLKRRSTPGPSPEKTKCLCAFFSS